MYRLIYERKTYYLGVEDVKAIQAIKQRYGLSTDSDAVRLSLRLVAESQIMKLPGERKRKG